MNLSGKNESDNNKIETEGLGSPEEYLTQAEAQAKGKASIKRKSDHITQPGDKCSPLFKRPNLEVNYDERIKEVFNQPHQLDAYRTLDSSYKIINEMKIFDQGIPLNAISPNRLHDRFGGTGNVVIRPTETWKQISSLVKNMIPKNLFKLNLIGPIGIGKSFGLLAEVLRLRKEGNIVLYFNNPEQWIQRADTKLYLVNELIYAAIPCASMIEGPDQLLGYDVKENRLFHWFCVLSTLPLESLQFQQAVQRFLEGFKKVADLKRKPIIVVSDQENVLMRKTEDHKVFGEIFPFNVRNDIGHFKIFSCSANNDGLWKSVDLNNQFIFSRIKDEHIRQIAQEVLEPIKIQEEQLPSLYQICNGNPLEAKNLAVMYQQTNEIAQRDLNEFISQYSDKRQSEVREKHQYFIDQRLQTDAQFKQKFNSILPYVDAEIKIDDHPLRKLISECMNRQFMTINPDTRFLECLHPVASAVFSTLKEFDDLEAALTTILYSQKKITADTIGRLLELYIIKQLSQDSTRGKTVIFKSTQGKKLNQKFHFSPYTVVQIPTGTRIPKEVPSNTLFVPESSTYPYVDLIYLDLFNKVLYGIQITVNMLAHKQSHQDFEKIDFANWNKLYDNKLTLRFIWLGGGWDPSRLIKELDSVSVITDDSWIVSYKQLPVEVFPLFQFLHSNTEQNDMNLAIQITNINKQMGKSFRATTKASTFQLECSNWFQAYASEIKDSVEIFGVLSSGNHQEWKQFSAYFLFEKKTDMDLFEKSLALVPVTNSNEVVLKVSKDKIAAIQRIYSTDPQGMFRRAVINTKDDVQNPT